MSFVLILIVISNFLVVVTLIAYMRVARRLARQIERAARTREKVIRISRVTHEEQR